MGIVATAALSSVWAKSSLEEVGVWCLLSYVLMGPSMNWLLSSQDVICACTSFDHSDAAFPREGDKDDLEKNKTASDQKSHLVTEEERVNWW